MLPMLDMPLSEPGDDAGRSERPPGNTLELGSQAAVQHTPQDFIHGPGRHSNRAAGAAGIKGVLSWLGSFGAGGVWAVLGVRLSQEGQ